MNTFGERWALWKRFTLENEDGEVYLDRLRVVQTPWFGIYLHRFDVPDPGYDLHDHPWPFASLILRGGYVEEHCDVRQAPWFAEIAERCPDTSKHGVERTWRFGTLHTLGLTKCHRITRLLRVPTWTLVLVGRRQRDWGFYQPTGWVPWRNHDPARRSNMNARQKASAV